MGRLRAATGALLLAGGASVVAAAVFLQPPSHAQAAAPMPAFGWVEPAPAAVRAPAAPAAPDVPDPAPVAPLGASEPVYLEVPSVGLAAAVSSVGLNPDGSIEVPQPGPAYDLPAWYRYSPTPGELGPAVIVGHVDHSDGRPSAFYGLTGVRAGDEVRVRRADGGTVRFRVTAVGSYPKSLFPTDAVYGDLDRPALRLITCSGGIDKASGHYRDNTVVFATVLAPS